MTGGLPSLEQRVAREMRILDALPPVAMRPEALAALNARVLAEAAGSRRREQRLAWRRPLIALGTAAALLVAWGVGRFATSAPLSAAADAARLSEWVDAADSSSASVARLIANDAAYDEAVLPTGGDAAEAFEDWLFSFDALQDIGA